MNTTYRNGFSTLTERTMISKFDGTCRTCSGRIAAGTEIIWSKANGAKHAVCPVVEEMAAKSAPSDEGNEAELALALAEMAGDRVLDIAAAADRLLDAYESQNRLENLKRVRKGIYRVSLHGKEGRYVADHVNIQLIPNEKYGSVKIAEYHAGSSIGIITRTGSVRLWDNVEASSPHTKAVLAGLDILLGSADPTTFAQAFAVEASACMRCGSPLVDETSRARLLGPDCASKWE